MASFTSKLKPREVRYSQVSTGLFLGQTLASETKHNGDYCIVEGQKRLSPAEHATLAGGDELEKVLSRVAKGQVILPEVATSGCSVTALLHAIEFYSQAERLKDPASCFVSPVEAPTVSETVIHGLKDGQVLDISFPSSYQVQDPEYREAYLTYADNAVVYARLWKHTEHKASATVVAIHGWSMTDQRANSLAFIPGGFYALGLDVALIELPFHMRRAPAAGRGDLGALFLSADLRRTNEAISQAVSDLRELRLYLETKGPAETGCMGMSLGGYLAALWGSLDNLAFCLPVAPLSCMSDMAWDQLAKSDVAFQVQASGVEKEDLRRAFGFHSPLSHTLKLDKERVLIVGGVDDKVLPASQPEQLWRHWGRPHLLWLPGGHGMQLREGRGFARVCAFLEKALGISS